MQKIIFLFLFSTNVFSWGSIGHRVVAKIAHNHLSKDALVKIKKILGDETLYDVANWPDFIKSDKSWDKSHPWHYVSIPDGQTFDKIEKNPDGDVVSMIDQMIKILSDKKVSDSSKKEALKFLVHFVGDIHQPLHCGRIEDKGGNGIKVRWFNEETNLHAVWDEHLIELQKLSYTEYVQWIDHSSKEQIKKWQSEDINVWLKEDMELRAQVYDIGDSKLKWDYSFKNIATVNERLLKAGIRLAGILEKLF